MFFLSSWLSPFFKSSLSKNLFQTWTKFCWALYWSFSACSYLFWDWIAPSSPSAKKIANEFVIKGNALWIILFGFALGFSSTIAEPTLTVVAGKVGALAAGAGAIRDNKESIDFYVWALDLRLPFLWAQQFL
jgi:hypothetical protein